MNNIQRIEQILLSIFDKEVGQERIKNIIVSFTEKQEGDVMTEDEKQEAFLLELKSMVLEKIQNKAQKEYMDQTLLGLKQVMDNSIIGL